MIDSKQKLEKAQKVFYLIEESLLLNGIKECDAIEGLIYAMIIYFGANKIHKGEVKKYLDYIETYHDI